MERSEAIEIPFGAKDSELKGWEYTIPEGMEAVIKDGKIIVREKESEDERMIKSIIKSITDLSPACFEIYGVKKEDILAWLEKQGEQKVPVLDFKAKDWYVSKVDGKIHNIYHSVDKVEPKFKVGDIITDIYCTGKVIELTDDSYLLDTGQGIPFSCEHNTHLWTIQDAKVGDVLYSKKGHGVEAIDLVSGWKKVDGENSLCSACTYRIEDDEILTGGLGAIWWDGVQDPFYPATKEQRDLLFQKMKEAGYEWNAEKKE